MKILLVEDNTLNAELYVKMLATCGYQDVDWRTTGLEGLDAALRTTYHAYLIDLDLPDIDGLQVGLTIRRHMYAQRIAPAPILALTARTDTATQREAAFLGFDALIGKPCSEADFEYALRRLTSPA